MSAIKIDRTFVRNLATDPDALAITASIIELARSLGVRVIAEGVETPQQLAVLKQRGGPRRTTWAPALPPPALIELLGHTDSLLVGVYDPAHR